MRPRWDTFGILEFFGDRFPGWRSLHSLTPRYLLSSLPGCVSRPMDIGWYLDTGGRHVPDAGGITAGSR